MDARWTGRCDETPQDTNRLQGANFGQLATAAPSPYYPYPQALAVPSISPQALHWASSEAQRDVPARAKASKVTKLPAAGRRGSCQSSLTGAVQNHLEQFVQQGNNNINGDAAQMSRLAATGSHDHPDSAVNLPNAGASVHGSTSIPSLHSSMQNAFDANGGPFPLNEGHQLRSNITSPSHSSLDNNDVSVKNDIPTPVQTAADVALKVYPSVKIESTLCKRLAGEPARQEPTQRRRDQKLNTERRSNVEALLALITGQVAPIPCTNCHKGHGPWTQCVAYDGLFCGSCSNCWFNASGSRCSFHENNNPQNSLFSPTAQTPSVQPGAMLNFQQQPMLSSNSPSVIAPYQADVAQCVMGDPTRNMINNVIGDSMTLSKKDRYVARIEAAAKELGMRIAELEEYLHTPEGVAEQQREHRYHLAQQGQIGDVSMDEDSPKPPVS
ncbi:hypothetical protein E4U43_003713 [Claviceps pusilla]|uniref:Uncharacterized protein n=1 Tax=Claviceps pusilla TaxID=123648 RepID=A0A9P7T341_9HYPO|nr:hypothetical protein E4U43_003713 [Claviceps pusilla]